MVTMEAVCVECEKPITITCYKDGRVTYRHDPECLTPRVRLLCDNPKKLGVITSEV